MHVFKKTCLQWFVCAEYIYFDCKNNKYFTFLFLPETGWDQCNTHTRFCHNYNLSLAWVHMREHAHQVKAEYLIKKMNWLQQQTRSHTMAGWSVDSWSSTVVMRKEHRSLLRISVLALHKFTSLRQPKDKTTTEMWPPKMPQFIRGGWVTSMQSVYKKLAKGGSMGQAKPLISSLRKQRDRGITKKTQETATKQCILWYNNKLNVFRI